MNKSVVSKTNQVTEIEETPGAPNDSFSKNVSTPSIQVRSTFGQFDNCTKPDTASAPAV